MFRDEKQTTCAWQCSALQRTVHCTLYIQQYTVQYGTVRLIRGPRYFVGCVWLEVQTRPPPPLACFPNPNCHVIHCLAGGQIGNAGATIATTALGINDKPPAPGPAPRALDRVGGRACRQTGHSHTGCGHRLLYCNPRLASPRLIRVCGWRGTTFHPRFHLGLHSQTMAPESVFIGSKSIMINLRIVRINALWWS
jgi:hypothetical protein